MIIRTRGFLPHFEREKATYFVTFRLAGSLPATVLNAWQRERDEIIRNVQFRKKDYRRMKNAAWIISIWIALKIIWIREKENVGCQILR